MNDNGNFEEIVASYRRAAEILGVEDHLRTTIEFVAGREDYQHRCPSCRHSRARHDVVEVAEARAALPVYDRHCIFRRLTGLPHCPHWQPLEVSDGRTGELCYLCHEEPAPPDDRLCPGCRAYMKGLSPRTKRANRPGGGSNHGWLATRRRNGGH